MLRGASEAFEELSRTSRMVRLRGQPFTRSRRRSRKHYNFAGSMDSFLIRLVERISEGADLEETVDT